VTTTAADGVDEVGRWPRRLVALALVLLLVPGLVGFDRWPLTAWRLFSLARGDAQTHWVLDAVDDTGRAHAVSLERLPLPYRTAEWPMAELPHQSQARRDDVCRALLGAVVEVRPATRSLRLVRDRQHQVRREGEWVVDHDREVFHTCDREPAP
jgi:hypothetical protein